MDNRVEKPKKGMNQLVSEMKDSRGISFNYFNESDAVNYLTNVNNYLRTAAYRKNYLKYKNGHTIIERTLLLPILEIAVLLNHKIVDKS